MKIGVIGAGTWGVALARMLTNSNHDVIIWSAIESEIDELSSNRKHKNLPGMVIPGLICGICGLAMSAFWLVYFGIFALAFIVAGVEGSLPSEEVYLGLSQLFR